MKLINLITERVQETHVEEFKSWWMEKRNNDEDPINIEFDIEGVDFKRSLRNAIDVEVPGHIFFILSKLWEMWGTDSGNEQILNTIEDRHEFGKKLMFLMRKNDFVFDKEAMGAKTAVDRQDKDAFQKEYPDVGLNEKKIGFNRGPEYSEEAEDLLDDFAKSTEMINKELKKKIIDSEDPKVQEILNLLDDNLDPEFIDDLEAVYNLIQELPDKPTDKPKVGFKQSLNEQISITTWPPTNCNFTEPPCTDSYVGYSGCDDQNVNLLFTLNNQSYGMNGVRLSDILDYMAGDESALAEYNDVGGSNWCCTSLAQVTDNEYGYGQADNLSELCAIVYPNLLGSINNNGVISENAFDFNPLLVMFLPELTDSLTWTTPEEINSMLSNCGSFPGCTDPDTINYDPDATEDDGSCNYDAGYCPDGFESMDPSDVYYDNVSGNGICTHEWLGVVYEESYCSYYNATGEYWPDNPTTFGVQSPIPGGLGSMGLVMQHLEDLCPCCPDYVQPVLRWQCSINAGECVSSEDPSLPFATLEECEAADNACGPQDVEMVECYSCDGSGNPIAQQVQAPSDPVIGPGGIIDSPTWTSEMLCPKGWSLELPDCDENLETCYKCDKNGNVVAQQFPGPPISWECPKGWSLQEPDCKQPLDADGDGYVDSVNINKPKKKPVSAKASALREMLQRRAGIDTK